VLAARGLDDVAAQGAPPKFARTITLPDALTPRKDATTFNNFYEFGIDKSDPAKQSKNFKPRPWSVAVEGACGKRGRLHAGGHPQAAHTEERVYRHRCVEGWSMVVPWLGFPLANLLKALRARRPRAVRRVPHGPAAGRNARTAGTLLLAAGVAVQRRPPHGRGDAPAGVHRDGLYGEELPNQNGAPLRLVVPWKYGFKSGKSIAKIRFVEKQPTTAWMKAARELLRVLLQREPGRDELDVPRSVQRAAARRVLHAEDDAVQRVRRPGRVAVRGHGPAAQLLTPTAHSTNYCGMIETSIILRYLTGTPSSVAGR